MSGFSTQGVNSTNTKATMAPGPEVKAVFDGVEIEDKTGNIFFNFSNDTGKLKHREFKIDRTHPDYKPKNEKTTLERIKHIACGFVEEEEVDGIVADTFEQWAEGLRMLLEHSVGTECVLKVTVNKNNFAGFPWFPNFLSTDFRPCKWTNNPTFDKFEFSAEKPDANPEGSAAALKKGTPSQPSTDVDDQF